MGWRNKMGGADAVEHFRTFEQKAQKEQKVDDGVAFATSATIADRVEKVKSYPEPRTKQITCHAESKILNRTVKMILDPNTPDEVVFDGATYTKAEISKLKALDRESLVAAHDVKKQFEGAVQ